MVDSEREGNLKTPANSSEATFFVLITTLIIAGHWTKRFGEVTNVQNNICGVWNVKNS